MLGLKQIKGDIFNNKIDFSYMAKGFKTPKLINLKRLNARSSYLVTSMTN